MIDSLEVRCGLTFPPDTLIAQATTAFLPRGGVAGTYIS